MFKLRTKAKMILEFIRFEWIFRKKRAATWIYVLISFLFVVFLAKQFLGQTTTFASYYECTNLMHLLSFILVPIVSAIMGISILRDKENQFSSIILTKPITKFQIYLGRFAGSYTVVLLIFAMLPLGLIVGYIFELNAFPNLKWLSVIFNSFILAVVPNTFITAVIFFGVNAVFKKRSLSFSQGFLFLISYQLILLMSRNVPTRSISRFFEPMGVFAFRYDTMYLTSANKSNFEIPFDGSFVLNRIFIITCGLFFFYLFYFFFNYDLDKSSENLNKYQLAKNPILGNRNTLLLNISDWEINDFLSFIQSSKFYLKLIFKETFFIIISSVGLLFVCYQLYINFYQADFLPAVTTGNVVQILASSLYIFSIVLVIYYAGDIIYKESIVRFSSILEVSPAKRWVLIASKALGFMFGLLTLTVTTNLIGIFFQFITGDSAIKWSAYFWSGFLGLMTDNLIYLLFFFFIQTLISSKSVGPIITMFIYFGYNIGVRYGFENPLYSLNNLSLYRFNDWNGFGQYFEHYWWSKLYWLLLGLALFILSITLYSTDKSQGRFERFKHINDRLTTGMKSTFWLAIAGFVAVGSFIYVNVEYKGEGFISNLQHRKILGDYERENAKYDTLPQPKIKSVLLNLEFQKNRNLVGNAVYSLKNETNLPITKIYIQEPFGDAAYFINKINLNVPASDSINPRLKFHIFKLQNPLNPQDSVILTHEILNAPLHFSYASDAFTTENIEENGTSFSSQNHLISIGFNKNHILKDLEDREDEVLSTIAYSYKVSDLLSKNNNVLNNDADLIQLKVDIKTANSQTVMGLNEIKTINANHFQSSLDKIPYHFSFVIGNFQHYSEKINGTPVEYGFHPEHQQFKKMIQKATKEAFEFCSLKFGKYPFEKLTITESAPVGNELLKVYPGTIILRENLMLKTGTDPDAKYNRIYELVSRSIAQQWFGFGVIPADVNGNLTIRNGIPKFITATLIEKQSLDAKINYLGHEHQVFRASYRSYLNKNKEINMQNFADCPQINAIGEMIGKEKMIEKLRFFYQKYNQTGQYPSYKDLIETINENEKVNLSAKMDSLIEKRIFYDQRIIDDVKVIKNFKKYAIIIPFEIRKYQILDDNSEKTLPLNELFQIAIINERDKIQKIVKFYPKNSKGKITIEVDFKPEKVFLDPLYRYYDLVRQDNKVTL